MVGGGSITIKEIAELAGVSVATVSRVFSDADTVSERTRKHVLAVAKKYHYEPNLLGRNLRTKETKVILIILTTIANHFCSRVVRGINAAAQQAGYTAMICATNDLRESEESYLDLVRNHLADGAIIINTLMSEEEVRDMAQRYHIVQCSEYVDEEYTPYVSIDNRLAAREAAEHLISLGRKRILYLTVDNQLVSTEQRFLGYQDALRQHNIPFDPQLVCYGNYGYRNGGEVVAETLRQKKQFDAVFAISDRMAAGAVTALKHAGLRVPEDVAVVGFDNTDISYILEPQLSTVAQPQQQMGEIAFELLVEKMKNNKISHQILQHRLILRQSTNI